MSRGSEDLRRMVLLSEATYNALCSKPSIAERTPPAAALGVLEGPREVLGKNLVGMQQQLQELDATQEPANANAQLQRSQLESKLLNARRVFFRPSPPESARESVPRSAPQEPIIFDAGGVPKGLRTRFRRLADRLFPDSVGEEDRKELVTKSGLSQSEVKDLLDYVVRDKPLKQHIKRPPSGLQNFLEFIRKQDVDPTLLGKHVREELRDERQAEESEDPEEKLARIDPRGGPPADMQMLENYETLS